MIAKSSRIKPIKKTNGYRFAQGSLSSLIFSVLVLMTPDAKALLDLSQEPLFLGTAVRPNIFFMLDDSGSMGLGYFNAALLAFLCL